MTTVRLMRSAGFVLALVILATSGIYVVVDLARWEWNRAVISGLIFLSSLIVLVAMMLFRQLHVLETRMAALERQQPDATDALGTIRAANITASARRFRWLASHPDRLGVFVPVLLGAGAVLSFVAYLIERVAGAFASAALDPRTVRTLGLDLPLGHGLVQRELKPALASPARKRGHAVIATFVTAALALTLVQGLRNLTQSRPGEVSSSGATSIVLEISQRRQNRSVSIAAAGLWATCRSRLPDTIELLSITPTTDGVVRLELDGALGRTGRARIIGCLEDYTLDLVQADVISLDTVAAS